MAHMFVSVCVHFIWVCSKGMLGSHERITHNESIVQDLYSTVNLNMLGFPQQDWFRVNNGVLRNVGCVKKIVNEQTLCACLVCCMICHEP